MEHLESQNIRTEVPKPTLFQTDIFSPSETHLLSLQSIPKFPLKMEIRLRQETLAEGHHLCMPFTFRTGTTFCLYLSIFDCLRCPPIKVRHVIVSCAHPVAWFYVVCEPRASPSGPRAAGLPCVKTLPEAIGR